MTWFQQAYWIHVHRDQLLMRKNPILRILKSDGNQREDKSTKNYTTRFGRTIQPPDHYQSYTGGMVTSFRARSADSVIGPALQLRVWALILHNLISAQRLLICSVFACYLLISQPLLTSSWPVCFFGKTKWYKPVYLFRAQKLNELHELQSQKRNCSSFQCIWNITNQSYVKKQIVRNYKRPAIKPNNETSKRRKLCSFSHDSKRSSHRHG